MSIKAHEALEMIIAQQSGDVVDVNPVASSGAITVTTTATSIISLPEGYRTPAIPVALTEYMLQRASAQPAKVMARLQKGTKELLWDWSADGGNYINFVNFKTQTIDSHNCLLLCADAGQYWGFPFIANSSLPEITVIKYDGGSGLLTEQVIHASEDGPSNETSAPVVLGPIENDVWLVAADRKSTRLNSSHHV